MAQKSGKNRSPESSAFYIAGFILLGIVVAAFVISLFWTPYAPDATDAASKFLAPCAEHPFGTDNFGRDVLSRIMSASKYTIFISVSGVAIALILGTVSGIPAGYYGGMTDKGIMLIGNSIMCFPGILLALVAVAVFGASVTNVIWALGLVFAPTFARVCRLGTMEIKELADVKKPEQTGGATLTDQAKNSIKIRKDILIVGYKTGFVCGSFRYLLNAECPVSLKRTSCTPSF